MNLETLKSKIAQMRQGKFEKKTVIESDWHRHENPDGRLGGWVENNCHVDKKSTVRDGAIVCNYSTVESSTIHNGAMVRDNAIVRDNEIESGTTVDGAQR